MGGSAWRIHDTAGPRKYVSTDERATFLEAADIRSGPLLVLAFAGCRISEALPIRMNHVDVNYFTVTPQTLKRRELVLRAVPVRRALIEMLLHLPPTADGRFRLCIRGTAWRIIKDTMCQAGVAGSMACPEALRDGFGI